MQLPLHIIVLIALVFFCVTFFMWWRYQLCKDGYRNLPDAAAKIILPELDSAVQSLGGAGAPSENSDAITMTPSKMYYLTKKDKYVGSIVNGFYVIDDTKFKTLLQEYSSVYALLTDLKESFPDLYQKII